jgi:hypothetical protein
MPKQLVEGIDYTIKKHDNGFSVFHHTDESLNTWNDFVIELVNQLLVERGGTPITSSMLFKLVSSA